MQNEKMTVREFITLDVDMNVYDEATEKMSIAFVGPQKLTAEGEAHFADALDTQIQIADGPNGRKAAYIAPEGDEYEWEKQMRGAVALFLACAGYCTEEHYDSWFEPAD